MATLLDALSQENLDNQREVVKNEKRWSYDNRPYGSWQEKLQAHLFPPEHPYHHSTIGSMDDLDAASLEDVSAFFRTYYAPNNAVLSVVGDVETAEVLAAAERFFGRIPANPDIPPLGDLSLPMTLGGERRETVHDRVPLPRVHSGSGRRSTATCASTRSSWPARSWPAARAAGSIGGSSAKSGSPRTWSLFTLGFVGGASVCAGWATVRPGIDVARVEAAFNEELARLTTELVSEDELARAKALTEADELGSLQRVEERADRLSMFATLFDDPGLINTMLPRYLAVTPEAIRDVAAEVFRADNRLVITYLPEGPPPTTWRCPDRRPSRPTRRPRHERDAGARTRRRRDRGTAAGRGCRGGTSSRR